MSPARALYNTTRSIVMILLGEEGKRIYHMQKVTRLSVRNPNTHSLCEVGERE